MNAEDINKKIKSDGSIEVKLNVDVGVFKKGDIGIIDGGSISPDGKTWEILIEGNPNGRKCWAMLDEFEVV